MLSDKTLQYGEILTPVVLGLDQLYRNESGDKEGLVVVKMTDSHQAEYLPDYTTAAKRFEDLAVQAAELPEADRQTYYRQFCESMLNFIRWRTDGLPFVDQLAGFLHVDPQPASQNEIDQLCSKMDTLLDNMGYKGDLAAKASQWEEKNRVPREEVETLANSLFDLAWDRTNEKLPIPADKSDGMKVKGITGMAFNARCNYLARTVELNIDPVLTLPGLKHLVVHEGYPGHYVQFKLAEVWYREGKSAADGLLSVVNTASSTTFEGIADNGMTVIEWIEDDDDALQMMMNRHRAGIGTVAAWMLHKEGKPVEEVTDWLRSAALTGGEGWVQNRIKFIGAPERAVLIWSYWYGEPSVTPVYLKVTPERRPEFFNYLYGRKHSPQTVAMFH